MEPIAITGMGMVSSLGYDVKNACAAARAGIVRSEEVDFSVQSPDDGSIIKLIGHQIPELTRGFVGFARLLRITQAGLTDLQEQVPDRPWEKLKTGFYLSLPDQKRIYTGFDLLADDEFHKQLMEESKNFDVDANFSEQLIKTAALLNNWTKIPSLQFATQRGHTGISETIRKAEEEIHAGKVDLAIVGGIDSLFDSDTLSWLESTGRLKTSEFPAGLQPGEAGAFFLLESIREATRRGGKVYSHIKNVMFGEELNSLLSGKLSSGNALAQILTDIIKTGEIETDHIWVLTDQNGENFRAIEWGNANVNIITHLKSFQDVKLWYPAISFGDTGAAYGAVSICLSVSAAQRGYAPAMNTIVISSDEDVQRSGILLRFN